MPLHFIPLGTNGFYPSFGRQTMSFLLADPRTPGRALLLDAGSGVGRLFTGELEDSLGYDPLAGIDHLEIFLSHYHLDHVMGLATLSHAWDRRLWIHAPTDSLVEASGRAPEQTLERLLSPPLFPVKLNDFAANLDVLPYDRDSPLEMLGFECNLRGQTHPGGSVGLRIGDALAYVTDTPADAETIDFARGVSLLIHELWVTDQEAEENPKFLKGHSRASDVADIATEAQVGTLLPVHHHPKRTQEEIDDLLQFVADKTNVPVLGAQEGEEYAVDAMEAN